MERKEGRVVSGLFRKRTGLDPHTAELLAIAWERGWLSGAADERSGVACHGCYYHRENPYMGGAA